MKINIITSCTSEKAVSSEAELKKSDFQIGLGHIAQLEQVSADILRSAGEMYTGRQHLHLMHGVKAARENAQLDIKVSVLSAGYGLIDESQAIMPYEVTFAGMHKKEIKEWSNYLLIPQQVRQNLQAPYDLGIILLGDNYLEACQLDEKVHLGGPTVIFCGTVIARKLPALPNLKVITLNNAQAKEFSCGIIGLKGELAGRLLRQVSANGSEFLDTFFSSQSPLTLLGTAQPPLLRPLAPVDYGDPQVITLTEDWLNSQHKNRIRYFIPDWDDMVDPTYDFLTDTHSGGKASWKQEKYAHELYPQPNYDGLLVSRAVVEKSRRRKHLIETFGIHRSMRVPDEFPVMGDCGAFDYIMQETPPYSTADVIDYYTKYGFDLGVSVDHLIVGNTFTTANERYQLTINNAEDFLREHRQMGLPWRPIGAVQGWDAKSYANAAEQYVKMGYDYIALGGLVRTSTIEMLHILSEVNKVVPASVDLHLFGIARPAALRPFARLGVTSVDSASHLRKAWMGTNDNYWTLDGEKYAAIRIPEIGKSRKAKELSENGDVATARILEQRCLNALRQYDAGKMSMEEALNILVEFDLLLDPNSKRRQDYEKTLSAKPWKHCPCTLCQTDGVEVIIFRGNNRNRRRGFHNTFVFYELMRRVLVDEQFYINEAHKLFEATTTPEALSEALSLASFKAGAKIEAKARAEARVRARESQLLVF
jgi:hypothetical protein